jgi:uncharacterized protein YbaP (TraB family)
LAQKGETKIYILGSMHLGKAGESFRSEIVTALKNSKRLVIEISVSEMARSNELARYICADPCLKKQISKAAYRKIAQTYPELIQVVDTMPAWLAASVLTVRDYMREGFMPNYGTESRLIDTVATFRSPAFLIVGLESAEEQYEVMASLSLKTQQASLDDYLNLAPLERSRIIKDLYAKFLEGDANALYDWYIKEDIAKSASLEAAEEINKKLVLDRNKRLAQRLLTQTESNGSIFVSIGALHLGGEEGVLALLRKEGFTISRR